MKRAAQRLWCSVGRWASDFSSICAVDATAASAEAAKALMAKGVQYILLSSDEGIIVKWGKDAISRIRG